MTESISLPAIIAHARAGSLDRAWAMFEAAGYDASRDSAALAIKGRLLKDRALRVSGEARAWLYGAAAEAYAAAAGEDGATYPLINAATLSLLSGDAGKAAALAQRVLARIEANPDEPETPYYLAATRAEALLLLGESTAAQAALAQAVALAPRAWEDHASTLRQFALILGAQGADAAWLDTHRPQRSLHFGGHMSFRADAGPSALTERIAALIAEERIGFGYGALAAGADILIAEALVAGGAELHLVIPGGLDAFAALSVDPWVEWRPRFDAVVARAATVRAVEPLNILPDSNGIALGDEIAIGAARINARHLASEALQLIVLAEGADEARNHSMQVWSSGGGRQHVLRAPREPVDPPLPVPPRRQACLAALAIRAGGDALAAIADVLAEGPATAVPPSFTGEAVLLAFDAIGDAAACAVALAGAVPGAAVGGYYGIAETVADPFSRDAKLAGRALAIAHAAAESALPGSACVSDDFAAALAAMAPNRFSTEAIGELDGARGPVGLFALRAL
jgi:hypothetical protein